MSWAVDENNDNITNSINNDDDLNTRLLANNDRAVSTDRSSLESRNRKDRMKSIEFEESPRKLSVYIDLHEASRFLNPYHLTNIGIFASYLAVGFGMYNFLPKLINRTNYYYYYNEKRYVFYTNTIELLYGIRS
jgi:hypothetical protein